MWYHVVGVYDGANVRIYVNGSCQTYTGAMSGNLIAATGPLQIGMEDSWPAEYLVGAVDEVGIWNKALTSTDVTTLYNSDHGSYGNYPQAASMVAGYHFDEGSGTTIHDFVHPNDPEHDGTLHGNVEWLSSGRVAHMYATAVDSSLALGAHVITADFGGYGDYTSSSTSIAETVLAHSVTDLDSTETTIGQGDAVTLTATVSADTGTPTGFVDFFAGSTKLGSAPLSAVDNTASLTTTAIPVGLSQTLTAVYEGDAAFAASPEDSLSITVLPISPPVLTSSV
ncbi:MAG TPA: Ig-like domain repeat protein, partial [Pirellulales bacterium]|nr:Ig-like domain repeat protein [Pirellulales bacterium]